MGVHKELALPDYWEDDKEDPKHSIQYYMRLTRFNDIHRWFHVANASQRPVDKKEKERF